MIPEIFWSKVKKTKTCWLWTGAKNSRGHPVRYGKVSISGKWWKHETAHRVAWKLTHGKIPADKMVCHKCAIPLCVKPTHLYLGTDSDNQLDQIDTSRWKHIKKRKSVNKRYKITEKTVRWILENYRRGKGRKMAKRFKISPPQISRIVNRKGWAWVR
jgi:hypothetical protein